MKAISLFLVLASTSVMAIGNLQQADCSGRGVTVHVDVDVLESNPPQSQISVNVGRDRDGFSAFTEYVVLESNPSQDQWTWKSHDGDKFFRITSFDGKSGRGYLKLEGRSYELTCSLQ